MAKFMVSYRFHGRSSETIEAETLADAKALIDQKVNGDDFELDADEIDDIDFDVAPLHPVTRDCREVWTTFVRNGDVVGHQSALASAPLFAVGVGA